MQSLVISCHNVREINKKEKDLLINKAISQEAAALIFFNGVEVHDAVEKIITSAFHVFNFESVIKHMTVPDEIIKMTQERTDKLSKMKGEVDKIVFSIKEYHNK